VALEDDLFEHCLGDQSPSHTLLNIGSFPGGWVDQYFRLLAAASGKWGWDAAVPMKASAAVHFASMYLHLRYKAWAGFKHSENPTTEIALAQIRSRSEFWLLGPLVTHDSEHHRQTDEHL